ncbi:MAG TPA: phage major capsid protein [Pseudonocardiaceae bacterium]|jgi:HK97 family phage major capsid protein
MIAHGWTRPHPALRSAGANACATYAKGYPMGWTETLKSGRICGVARDPLTGKRRRRTFGYDYADEIAARAWIKETEANWDGAHAEVGEPVTRQRRNVPTFAEWVTEWAPRYGEETASRTSSVSICRSLAARWPTERVDHLTEVDLTTTSISSGVFTVAGGQTVSRQLIDQSPLNVDKIVFSDLTRRYAIAVDQFVLSGTGVGQPTGITVVAGTNAVSYTDASPALLGTGKLYSKMANAIELIQTSRFDSPTAILMHPRRWGWICVQSDTANRPAVVPTDQGAFNAAGVMDNASPASNHVGRMFGLPAFTDASIPTNVGAGTHQDTIIIAKFDDLYLWESGIRAQAFEQTFAQNLSIFLRLFAYMSFQPARYPASITLINGTGLVAPNW